MGNHFVTSFLSTIDLATARKLFAEEQPDSTVLNLTVDKLIEQQAFDNLAIILTLLCENEAINPYFELKSKVLLPLLIEALDSSNDTQIREKLKHLDILLLDNQTSWQAILSQLISWIESHPQHPGFLLLLQHLPATQRERLYSRLLETADGNPSWLATLITYILSNRPSDSLQKELHRHFAKLASYVLLSPVSHDNINTLSLALTTEQLVNIIFQLRAIAATYSSETREKLHQRFSERRQIYLYKYDALATALTVRATNSQAEYEQLIHNNSELANILMIKRLKRQVAYNRQKELVLELLTHSDKYDLKDPLLKAAATESFLTVFTQLSQRDLIPCFRKYYLFYSNKNLAEVIRFLDLFSNKTHDLTKILSCINEIDDEDRTITINFVTTSKVANYELMGKCLERLNEKQLINLCGHMMALRQITRNEGELLSTIYYRILAKKISASPSSTQHFLDLARAIKLLPDEFIDESTTSLLSFFKTNSVLHYQWLSALFAVGINKTRLLSPCCELLKQIKPSEKLSLLQYFSSEELLVFYLYMLRNNASIEDFDCLVELLKTTDRQPLLLYLLLNTPPHQAFLDQLMPFIEDKNLITLIEQLIDKVKEDKDYTATLNELLKHFCHRLQTAREENAPLHQWVDGSQYVEPLALHLLENPVCFYLLSSRSSFFQELTPMLLKIYLGNNAAADLKLRINRLLNLIHLTPQTTASIALNLLSYFQSSPKKLQTLFTNLEAAQHSLNHQGQQNYRNLKQACWHLLKPKTDHYDDTCCVTLLTTQLGVAHCFDPVLAKLAVNISESEDAHLGAQYLTQIEAAALEQIAPASLAMILTKSTQDANLTNWQKVACYLKNRDLAENLVFIKNLISHLKKSTNPVLLKHALQFLTQLEGFEKLLPHLKEDELQWFLQECSNNKLIKKIPYWCNLLLNQSTFDKLNYASLFILLPQEQHCLESIYQNENLKPHLHTLFTQLASLNAKPAHFITLFNELSKESTQQKRELIKKAQLLMQAPTIEPIALFVINMLLLTLDDLQINSSADVQLVLQHLQLISNFAKKQQEKSNSPDCFSHELHQLILNTFSYLFEQNSRWANQLLVSEEFSHIAVEWLNQVDAKSIERHPFTKLLLQNATLQFHPTLIYDPRFQAFVKQLLTTPPASMNEDQFALLFEKLTAENQTELAFKLLQQPTLGDVQWSSLMILAHTLPVATLYSIYAESKTRFVFVDLLARHHAGMTFLSEAQRNTLIAEITSGKQVLRILDSYSPVATKIDFVDAIFSYLETTGTPLSSWLEAMNVDTQTMTAFSNFTTGEKNKQKLYEAIKNDHYYEHGINDYLQNPTLDMSLEPTGLLFSLSTQIALNPWKGWQCQFSLLKKLPPNILKQIIQNQFELFEQVNQLTVFFEPLGVCEEVAPHMLLSARWVQSLPLINSILTSISRSQRNSEFRNLFLPTALYQQVILPLLNESLSADQTPFESFYDLLVDYAQTIKANLPAHEPLISSDILQYQHHLQAIENYSFPKLIQLLRPHSYFCKIKNGLVSALHETEIELLSTAAQRHKEWLSSKKFSPSMQLAKLLTALLQCPKVLEDDVFRRWLLLHCFFSPIAEPVDENLLKQLISYFPTKELEGELSLTYQRIQRMGEAYKLLKTFNTTSSLSEITQSLYTQSVENLTLALSATQFAHLPHLSNLLLMVLQAKKTNLSLQQLQVLLLPSQFSHQLDVEWFHLEIAKLNDLEYELTERCRHLLALGLSAHNDSQDLARLTALSHSFIKDNLGSLTRILTSYQTVFSSPEKNFLAHKLLRFLENLHSDPQKTSMLLKSLNTTFVIDIINFALTDPKTYEELLLKIIDAGFGELYQNRLSAKMEDAFNFKRSKEDTVFLTNLSLEDFASLSVAQVEELLILQRLYFKLKPLPHLAIWSLGNEKSEYKQFCADASLYQSLLQMQQKLKTFGLEEDLLIKAKQNLAACFNFFSINNKAIGYYTIMEKFHREMNIQQPGIYFHWLCLLSFFTEDRSILISSFIEWLHQTSEPSLANQAFLKKLLLHILNLGLLKDLCKCLGKEKGITGVKANWLYEHIRTQSDAVSLISNIVLGFSWDWLKEHIKNSSPEHIALLDSVLQQENHVKMITTNADTKLTLYAVLNQCQFAVNDLINLQKKSDNPIIKSLIGAHLLGRQDFIDQLQGEAFIAQLADAEKPLCPRLSPLIKDLHLEELPSDVVKQLHPEAAATLLCSIKNFHRLDKVCVEPLLHILGEQTEVFISYWLTYLATMPNSVKPLIAMTNLLSTKIPTALANLSENKRHPILSLFIQHLNELDGTRVKTFIPLCEESHLNYAAHLYLYKGQSETISVQFIHELTDKLLEKKAAFSSQTIQLLMRLSEDSNFSALRGKLGRATSDYLRSSALFADCSIFYDEGRLNIKRMQKLVPLQSGQKTTEAQHHFLQAFTQTFKNMFIAQESSALQLNDLTINPLIDVIMKDSDKLPSFDYFLIHYHGKLEPLERCFNDYLDYLTENTSSTTSKRLHTIAWLLTRAEMNANIKGILFNALLSHPQLLDGQISGGLLMFNCEQAILRFGMNGNYQTVINLCSWGLPFLEVGSDDEKMAKRALKEAQFESSISTVTGFLAPLRVWLKRSFFYGWEAWFEPRKPHYVLLNNTRNSETSSSTIILQKLQTEKTGEDNPTEENRLSRENLETLLTHLDATAPIPSLTTLVHALSIYDWQKAMTTEIQTRKTVDDLFDALWQRTKWDKNLANWFYPHLDPFINNRQRLIGLYIQENQQEHLTSLLSRAVAGPGQFQDLANLLFESEEPKLVTQQESESVPLRTNPSSILEQVTDGFSSISSFFWTPISNKIENIQTYTAAAVQPSWLINLFRR
ncbi:hypothetical protein [Legionella jamestowniensis]|uniref:Dot/Icm T4SS effector n=1 Tax=Legionella jamestowniensis TaxID=455 RepID=A0A0W0UJD7_9GAMM|nr:hypothetical protein [Legionella jamestowniensis]KTD08017.1 Dot/Icm T4SS effector [Legionella jamestowniensis]SFM06546.1 hypothetical protein SAMN02746073_0220 [Legionella jamestowniensis DSM 19215]